MKSSRSFEDLGETKMYRPRQVHYCIYQTEIEIGGLLPQKKLEKNDDVQIKVYN